MLILDQYLFRRLYQRSRNIKTYIPDSPIYQAAESRGVRVILGASDVQKVVANLHFQQKIAGFVELDLTLGIPQQLGFRSTEAIHQGLSKVITDAPIILILNEIDQVMHLPRTETIICDLAQDSFLTRKYMSFLITHNRNNYHRILSWNGGAKIRAV